MKKWNAPEVAELNISETANGYYYAAWEGYLGAECVCSNDAPHGVCGEHTCGEEKGDSSVEQTS